MYDFQLGITDALLSIILIYFIVKLSTHARQIVLARWVILLFVGFLIGAVSGGLYHLFFPNALSENGNSYLLWHMVPITIGLTSSVSWCVDAYLVKNVRLKQLFLLCSAVNTILLFYILAVMGPVFMEVLCLFFPPAAIMLSLAIVNAAKKHGKEWKFLLLGVLFYLISPLVFYLPENYYTYFGVYLYPSTFLHIVQNISLFFLYLFFMKRINHLVTPKVDKQKKSEKVRVGV